VYFHPRALPDELYLVPEAFADAGYDTFFWSGHPMASARWGYGQGIPEEHVVATDRPRHRAPRGAASMKPAYRGSMLFPSRNRLTGNDAELDALIARLVADPDYRAYVQVFFTITHNPYYRRFDAATFDAFASAHPELVGELTAEDIERNLDLLEANEHGLQYNHAATVARLGLSKGEVGELARVQELFYRVCVAELDRFFGRFLDKLRENGLYDQSLIAFTSDHGEMLHRDNALFSWTHGEQLVPEVLQVPLIVRSPVAGVEPGRYADVTRSIDVFPTLASLCGIALPARAAIEGVDLSAAVRGEADPPELRAFAHTALVNDIHALADEDAGLRNALFPAMDPSSMWTLMRNRERAYKLRRTLAGDWQLQVFDWDADPTERRDLYDASNREHAAARAELEAYKALLVRSYRPDSELDGDTISDEETAERLRALGYVK
jgi:arylsulfatase A-like enzyme